MCRLQRVLALLTFCCLAPFASDGVWGSGRPSSGEEYPHSFIATERQCESTEFHACRLSEPDGCPSHEIGSEEPRAGATSSGSSGSLVTHKQGLVITTSDFPKGACEEANRRDTVPVALIKGEELVAWIDENDIEVTRLSRGIIELEE